MSAAHIGPKEMAFIYDTLRCLFAVTALLVYDWLLCLRQEIRYIWKWRSRVTVSTMIYACSRYGMLIRNLLIVAAIHPMSNLSCAAVLWTQTVTEILCVVSFSVFSALRAYVLSNRNIWVSALIILMFLPPIIILILGLSGHPPRLWLQKCSVEQIQCSYRAPLNLPSPYNCGAGNTLPAALDGMAIALVTRVSQLASEILVVGLTWWYSFKSYHVRKHGGDIGESLSSILIYNGSIYFLFLASLYIIDLVFQTAAIPPNAQDADNFLQLFYDPDLASSITSILVCRFMLSLRQFDASMVASSTYPGTSSQSRDDHTISTVLQFGAQPCEPLPPFIASFAHPVHVDWTLDPDAEAEADELGDEGSEWLEMDVRYSS